MIRSIGVLAFTLGIGLSPPGLAQGAAIDGSRHFTCDGASDVTSALQRAERERQAAGGALILPAGVCLVSDTITVRGPGKWVGAGSQAFTTSAGTIIRDTRAAGDTIAVMSHDGVAFEDFRIDARNFKTSGAGIAIGTPSSTLAADAASGATTIAVADPGIFAHGGQIAIGLTVGGGVNANNSTFITSVLATAPSRLTLHDKLPAAANAGNMVWAAYNQGSDLTRVVIRGAFDGLRLDCADFVTVTKSTFQDYANDGIKKVNQCAPDGGGDKYTDNTFWDLNRGTSHAGFEFQAGGDIALIGNKFLGSAYNFLVDLHWGPTGTVRVVGNSFEQARTTRLEIRQAAPGAEYGNVQITGNQFSNLPQGGRPLNAQLLKIAQGTPTAAGKWVRNIGFVGNLSNDYVTSSAPAIEIRDGDNIIISGNALNNNGAAGPVALQVSNATNVTCGPNQFTGYPSGTAGAPTAAAAPVRC